LPDAKETVDHTENEEHDIKAEAEVIQNNLRRLDISSPVRRFCLFEHQKTVIWGYVGISVQRMETTNKP
jgi:hypothetical protein